MTIAEERSDLSHDEGGHEHDHGGPRGIYLWLTSTDHKVIGKSYMYTSLIFMLIAGAMAMIIRAQLTGPNNHLVSQQTYNELFTIHGSMM